MRYLKMSTKLYACLIALAVVENKACTRKSNYYDRHPGLQLQGHVIKNMSTSDILNCIFECSKTPGCLSINSHNAGNVTHCELNKSNRYGTQANLIKTSFDREYLEMVFNPDWPDACFQKGGWYRSRSAAYKFVNEHVTAESARQRCRLMSAGADLVSFVNKEEEETFDQYREGLGQVDDFWIGFNDLDKEGTFAWFDETKSGYTNWLRGEPNDSGKVEDCTLKLGRTTSTGWIDSNCKDKKPFACKVLCT